jgi:hypothetical protein
MNIIGYENQGITMMLPVLANEKTSSIHDAKTDVTI